MRYRSQFKRSDWSLVVIGCLVMAGVALLVLLLVR